MGVTGGHKLTFRLLNLNFEHLLTTGHYLMRTRATVTSMQAGSVSSSKPATCVAKEGLYVTIVCDGARRHDPKPAIVDRQSK